MEGERFMEELEKKLDRATEGSEQKEVMSLKAKLKYTYNNEKTSTAFSNFNQRKWLSKFAFSECIMYVFSPGWTF